MPASGCVKPHHSWPTPNARLMLARPRPVLVLMTLRNRPIDWRAPIVTAKMPPAASRTRPRATGARARAARIDSDIAHLRLGFGQGGEAVVEQRMQLGDAAGAEALVEGELGPLPFALRLESLGATTRGDDDEARSAVLAGPDLGPAVGDQRLQVAGQGRRFHRHRGGEIAGPHRAEVLDLREQRVLGRLQPGGGDDPVIVLADATRELAQLEAGAALRRGGSDGIFAHAIIVAAIV